MISIIRKMTTRKRIFAVTCWLIQINVREYRRENPDKLTPYFHRVHKTKKTKQKHNISWTPLYTNKQTQIT